MDRFVHFISGWLVWIGILLLNELELCSCKPIKVGDAELDLVPCVVELIIPREPNYDIIHLPGLSMDIVKFLSEKGTWSRKKKKSVTEYTSKTLCVSMEPRPDITTTASSRPDDVKYIADDPIQQKVLTKHAKLIRDRRETQHLGRGYNSGQGHRPVLPHVFSWLWKARRNESKKK